MSVFTRSCFYLGAVLIAAGALAEAPLEFSPRRELFVDDYLIDSMNGVRLQLQNPVYAGPAFTLDKPWEGSFCGYFSILPMDGGYRCYYRGLPDAFADGSDAEFTCCAESTDGISWTKPELGIHEFKGDSANNIILADSAPFSHNFAPFYDTNPACPPDQRYKAIAGTYNGNEAKGIKGGLYMFVSPDGLRWTRTSDTPGITKGAFDSQNVGFWSESEQLYLCYLRTWSARDNDFGGFRSVSRATSKDFVTWTEPEQMTFGDVPEEHLYTNQTQPYFRAPHIYLGMAMRFMPGRKVLTPAQAESLGVYVDPANYEKGYASDCADAVLLSSRGGTEYTRTFMEAFIRPGTDLGNWASRAGMVARGLIQTGEAELSVYKQFHYAQPTAFLGRYTIRLDGFGSVHAPYEGGEFLTKPFRAVGDSLELNFATSAAGEIYVAVCDESGKPLEGYGLDECPPIIGDMVDRTVEWDDQSWSALKGKAVRLRVTMKDADLYAINFAVEPQVDK